MTCATCGRPTGRIEHYFYEGTCPESVPRDQHWKPVRDWTVVRPLYYHASGIEDFCGAACSATWHGRRYYEL